MARRRRQMTTFSLSFLDIMACGFGAVTLLFLILKHDPQTIEASDPDLVAEIELLQEDIRRTEEYMVELQNSLRKSEQDITQAQGLSSRVIQTIDEKQQELSLQGDPEAEIILLRQSVKELAEQTSLLEQSGQGRDLRPFIGDGQRQYLTGLKLGGRRVMILLDVSASMLSDSIVNILRRRNMDDASQRRAEKWRRAKRTAEWLVAQLPSQSLFQIYGFSTTATPMLEGTAGQWLDTTDRDLVENLFVSINQVVPKNGTNLLQAFLTLDEFEEPPDNLFLITDGFPTQGKRKAGKSTVTGKERLDLFNEAVNSLPSGLPVNVILFPMQGDPLAAAGFWQLAVRSHGSFLSPSRDWP